MYITTVKLQNFRNYENEIINLDKNINIFCNLLHKKIARLFFPAVFGMISTMVEGVGKDVYGTNQNRIRYIPKRV